MAAVVAGVAIVRTLSASLHGERQKAKAELASRAEHRLSRSSRWLDRWMARSSPVESQDTGNDES